MRRRLIELFRLLDDRKLEVRMRLSFTKPPTLLFQLQNETPFIVLEDECLRFVGTEYRAYASHPPGVTVLIARRYDRLG